MEYNVNVYQVVYRPESTDMEKERVLVRTMCGGVPSSEEFDKYYENVCSLKVNSDIDNVMEFCEYCFYILNDGNIDNVDNVDSIECHHPCRSLSVGDILEVNSKFYLVKMSGFDEFATDNALEKTI